MNKREMKKFEKLLLDQQSRLVGSIRNIEEASRAESGREAPMDLQSYAEAGTDNFDRETALNIAMGESNWLNEISEALLRIKEGNYGRCEECGVEIPKKRLEVYPSARYCVGCQEQFEKTQRY